MSSVVNVLLEFAITDFRILESGEGQIQQGSLDASIANSRRNQNKAEHKYDCKPRGIVKILAAGDLEETI